MHPETNTVIQKLRDEREDHIRRLSEWLEIPSVSTDGARTADVRRAAEFVRAELAEAGFSTRIEETSRHPVVLASWQGAPGAPTLLVYGHYDVQPPEPLELWRHGPFTPTREGTNLVARGATDDKGQCFALVRGIGGRLRHAGKLPVNVTFLIEGEEEIGSPNLTPFVEKHARELAADVVLISDTGQFGPGVPALTIGLRGLVYLEVNVTGADRDLHSGSFGGSVANPANALCRLFGSFHDDDGRVLIPGFYDPVRELNDDERRAMSALPFDEDEYRRALGVTELAGERGRSTLERRGVRPTLDVNGLLSGWTGEGAKTVLPCHAMGKFSMRLVPDQDPDVIRAAAVRFLEERLPPGLTITVDGSHGAAPVLVPGDGPFVSAAVSAIEKGFGMKPVFMHEGGSIPVVSTFKELLGLDTLLLGLGLPDDNTHAPNEKFNLDDYQRGIETVVHLLDELATLSA